MLPFPFKFSISDNGCAPQLHIEIILSSGFIFKAFVIAITLSLV